MNVLGTPLGAIDWSFIERLVRDRVPESITHDYKAALPSRRDDAARTRLLKSVSAFANTNGGVLIFGVDSESSEWSITGLANFDPDGDIASLANWLRSGIDPVPPTIEPHILTGAHGQRILLLGVGRSLASPHQLSLSNGGTFWRRDARGNYQMATSELRRAFREAETWRTEITGFRDSRLAFLNQGSVHPRLAPALGHVFLQVLPLGRLEELVATKPLVQFWTSQTVQFGGEEDKVSRVNIDGYLDCSIFHDHYEEYTQAFRNGGVENYWSLNNFMASPSTALEGRMVEGKIAKGTYRALRSLNACEVAPPFAVVLSFHEVRNKTLVYGARRSTRASFDRQTLKFPILVLDEYPRDVATALRPLFDSIWMAAGWEASPLFSPDGQWALAGANIDEL